MVGRFGWAGSATFFRAKTQAVPMSGIPSAARLRPVRGLAAFGVVAAFASLALLWLPTAQAHDESEAPALRADVAAVWHEPAEVLPGMPWQGFLRLAPESNITGAYFQVCRVGMACFAPPTAAQMREDGVYVFDSSQAGGEVPVHFGPGWRVGVKWLLFEGDSQTPIDFPPKATCEEPTLECAESEYFVFEVGAEPEGVSTPGASSPLLILAILALAYVHVVRRRRNHA